MPQRVLKTQYNVNVVLENRIALISFMCAIDYDKPYGLFNTLRTGSFKLFKRPFPGFLTILTL